jgi:hypothetical protein
MPFSILITLGPLHWTAEPPTHDMVIGVDDGTGAGKPGEGAGDGVGVGPGEGVGAGEGAGDGVGDGDGADDAYSQILSAPGSGSPKTSLLHPMLPVAVRTA